MSTTEYEAVPAVAAESTARAGTVVMKFGGTSVGDPQKLKDVAARIVAAHAEGTRVVAVLSAMGDTTDELVRLAYEISPRPEPRELDMLISVGERISCTLAAMAIHDLGDEAISLTGSQAGIVTDTVHGKAKIVDVRARRVVDVGERPASARRQVARAQRAEPREDLLARHTGRRQGHAVSRTREDRSSSIAL